MLDKTIEAPRTGAGRRWRHGPPCRERTALAGQGPPPELMTRLQARSGACQPARPRGGPPAAALLPGQGAALLQGLKVAAHQQLLQQLSYVGIGADDAAFLQLTAAFKQRGAQLSPRRRILQSGALQ